MGRKFALPAFWLLACSLQLSSAPRHNPPSPLELLKQLNSVTLDPTQVYVIRDAHITRGRMNLYLNRGFIAFLTPVKGEVTGAVFSGEGEVLMIPPEPGREAEPGAVHAGPHPGGESRFRLHAFHGPDCPGIAGGVAPA